MTINVNKFQYSGIGKLLLIDAVKRSFEVSVKNIGSMAIVVSPPDNETEAFYQEYGIIRLPDSGKMLLPMKTVAQLFTSP